ncbi:8-oxo-dGTP pyrophosphatase MutT (NUDIX family) [Friedmanniella endophytica]|uniref:8-oxo-dGTP pyrophosphatase MutT (NUDIX family) n=1 Tax=Microlunatus kandeliicorticis TaxID=1759536 RepID=A0A7W3IQT8_9ACTN|nr:NUDIX domain-containing protein [Microlunatus kandeliicorticis]MBA8793537.1 8-oxo-dGTP pyrophosphatase MutT (NUDIX family) [Microlunatus kandeliicorticis]
MSPDRAVAVVVRGGRLLVVTRHRVDPTGVSDYVVLPGGGIEPGETPEQAALRELAEETGLVADHAVPLAVRTDGGRTAHYLRVTDPGGDPVLGGPEAVHQSASNRYGFGWLGPDDLAPLRPAELRAVARAWLVGSDGHVGFPDR